MMDDIARSFRVRGSDVGVDVGVANERASMSVGNRRATTDPGVGP
jgi:hypothetical protein